MSHVCDIFPLFRLGNKHTKGWTIRFLRGGGVGRIALGRKFFFSCQVAQAFSFNQKDVHGYFFRSVEHCMIFFWVTFKFFSTSTLLKR